MAAGVARRGLHVRGQATRNVQLRAEGKAQAGDSPALEVIDARALQQVDVHRVQPLDLLGLLLRRVQKH